MEEGEDQEGVGRGEEDAGVKGDLGEEQIEGDGRAKELGEVGRDDGDLDETYAESKASEWEGEGEPSVTEGGGRRDQDERFKLPEPGRNPHRK